MGEFIAWIIGWDLILEYALGATTVAIGWSGYVVSFLSDLGIDAARPICSLAASHTIRRTGVWHLTGASLNVSRDGSSIVAIIRRCWSLACMNSARVNNVIVVIKVAIVVALHRGRRVVLSARRTG